LIAYDRSGKKGEARSGGPHYTFAKEDHRVTVYCFYTADAEFGLGFIKLYERPEIGVPVRRARWGNPSSRTLPSNSTHRDSTHPNLPPFGASAKIRPTAWGRTWLYVLSRPDSRHRGGPHRCNRTATSNVPSSASEKAGPSTWNVRQHTSRGTNRGSAQPPPSSHNHHQQAPCQQWPRR
jgi:hypothetical protein